jgi:hypothetical protein
VKDTEKRYDDAAAMSEMTTLLESELQRAKDRLREWGDSCSVGKCAASRKDLLAQLIEKARDIAAKHTAD